MRSILLGTDRNTRAEVQIPTDAFKTHFHLIGGTGKGKTTAIHTMLQPLLRDPSNKACFFIIDRLGNFSQELLLWMASRYCTDAVRKRLVYIQPAREDVVSTFNPLLYDTMAHGYYKVERATEIILRAWESVNIEAMPRLARWTFNSFWTAAQLGLTIPDCEHFLLPGSQYHKPLLNIAPPRLKAEWQEILSSKGGESTRILDSSRNRLKPYFESSILRRMFGSTKSRLDVLRCMKEGKIVLLDLAPRNRLSTQLGNTIGALVINEVLATARSLDRDVRYPTYLLLDEFQNFVGPDLESALPEVRQLGLRLILSHQSFSQLEKGNYDLTDMIFQAQSRLIFGVHGDTADLLAHEIASMKFDSRKIKEEVYSRRQLVKGHRRAITNSWSKARQDAENWSKQYGKSTKSSRSSSHERNSWDFTDTDGSGEDNSNTDGTGGSSGFTETESQNETLLPDYENFRELSSRTYESFEEQKSDWAKAVRNLRTGEALLRLVNDPTIYTVNVKRSTPGFLAYDAQTIAQKFPKAFEAVDRLVEENFKSDFFTTAEEVDREMEDRLHSLLNPPIVVDTPRTKSVNDLPQNPGNPEPPTDPQIPFQI